MSKKHISYKSQTDWERVDAQQDEDIDFSDCPEITPEMFAKAVIRKGLKPVLRKAQVTLRLDADILTWFRNQGKGYQTRINELLRAYMEAQQKQQKSFTSSGITSHSSGQSPLPRCYRGDALLNSL